jgi:hypothetical protein
MENGQDTSVSRRQVLAGSAVAVGVWAAPSILTLDRVAAAAGSCGAAPLRFDWSTIAPTATMPSSITADDGTVVSFALGGSTGLLATGYTGNVRTGRRGARRDYMALGLVGANNGAGVTLTMSFSQAVQACFEVTDVDRANGSWEDSISFTASNGGTNVAISGADLVPQGTSVVNVGANGAIGVASEGNNSSRANLLFTAPTNVDQVVMSYFDNTTWTSTQVIGIHDLRWC